MPAYLVVLLGFGLFLVFHLLSLLRPAWVDVWRTRLGRPAWTCLYSAPSLVGMGLMVYALHAPLPSVALDWSAPPFFKDVTLYGGSVALLLFFSGQFRVTSVMRYIRHPMLLSVLLWASVHLLTARTLEGFLIFTLFGLYAFWALVAHMTRPISDSMPQAVSLSISKSRVTARKSATGWWRFPAALGCTVLVGFLAYGLHPSL